MSIENKPIALVTGSPGSGKTAMLVDFIDKAAKDGRPIIQVGIPELKVSHIPPPGDMSDWTELREDPDMPGKMLPYFTFPERALVVLSEAQRLYRPRAAGAKLPDYVAAFETCRHTGVTFVLDTQHPDFIDSHIRKLIGQHIHLIDHGVLGRKHYEWPYLGNPDYFKAAPIKKPYKLPKHVFDLYKSSSLHIKRNYTMPPAVKIFGALVLALAIGGYLVGKRMYSKFEPAVVPASVEAAHSGTTATAATPGAAFSPVDAASLLVEFSPRVPGRPETAPAYDALRQVKNMPQVVGCFQSKSSCACQNQQGLDAGLDDMQCRQWIKNPRFDAYREPPMPSVVAHGDEAPKPANLPAGESSSPVAPSPQQAAPAPAPLTPA